MEKFRASLMEALMDFDSLPGVSAAFISNNRGVIAAKSGVFPPERIETIAGHIARAFENTVEEELGVDNITFSFANGLVVTRSIHNRASLNVLCVPEVNLSSLDLLMDLVINKVNKKLGKQGEAAGEGSSESPESLMKGPLGDSLKKIATSLCEHIGPAGDIVLSDSLKKWTDGGGSTDQGLTGLMTIIEGELGADGSEEWLLDLKKIIS